MSAAFTVTLPGPDVTASVTWDDERAYLKAEGWGVVGHHDCVEAWRNGVAFGNVGIVFVGSIATEDASECMSRFVRGHASICNVHPSEMLTRIAGCHDRTELRARLVAELLAAGRENNAESAATYNGDPREWIAVRRHLRQFLSAQLLADLGIADEEVGHG